MRLIPMRAIAKGDGWKDGSLFVFLENLGS